MMRLLAALYVVLGLVTPSFALDYRLADAVLPGCKADCPKIIIATGTIGQEEHLRLAVFIDEQAARSKLSKMLIIDSLGGFTAGGVYLGLILRKLKMTVVVGRWDGSPITVSSGLMPGSCASACVLALAGGTNRFIVPTSKVGVHRSHTGPEVLDPMTKTALNGKLDYEQSKNVLSKFFAMMGVSSALAQVADQTPSETIHWLSPAELNKFRLAKPISGSRPSTRR